MTPLTDANTLSAMNQPAPSVPLAQTQAGGLPLRLAGTNSRASEDPPSFDDDNDGGGNDHDDDDTTPADNPPDPKYISGCDFFMQMRDYMLNINFYQSVEKKKVENRQDKDFWDVVEPGKDEGDYTKIRYLTTPQLTIENGQVKVLFPHNEMEAKKGDMGVITCECRIEVAANFALEFETEIIEPDPDPVHALQGQDDKPVKDIPADYLEQPTEVHKVSIKIIGTAYPTPTSAIKLDGAVVEDDPDKSHDKYDLLLEQITKPSDFAKVAPDALDVAMLDIPIDASHFKALTFNNYLLILGHRGGALPKDEDVIPFTTGNDVIIGLSSAIAHPMLREILLKSITGKPLLKINDNYDFRISDLQVEMINGGMRLYDGWANCHGHAKGETSDSLFYPDVHVTINEMITYFLGVTMPDGKFTFSLPKPDLDVDNWELVKFILWGIETHSVGWGGSPIWWFFNPIVGVLYTLISTIISIATADRPSSKDVVPPDQVIAGARVQLVNLSFLPTNLVIYGQAQPIYPYTSSIGGNTMIWLQDQAGVAPARTQETEQYTFKYGDIWYEDPRYSLRWVFNGKTVKESFCGEDHRVQLGPLTKADFNSDRQATLEARLYRTTSGGAKELVHSRSIFINDVSIWGAVGDCYICNDYEPKMENSINHSRLKLHYAVPDKRCHGISRTSATTHKFWGLPPKSKDHLYTTCFNCFGYVKTVSDVRSALEAEHSHWLQQK